MRALTLALTAAALLTAGCSCSGARIYSRDAGSLAASPAPAEIRPGSQGSAPIRVAWLGTYQGRALLGGAEYLEYRFVRMNHAEGTLLQARWLEVLELPAGTVSDTAERFFVDASTVNDDGPHSDMGRATRSSAIWSGEATQESFGAVVHSKLPVIEVSIR